MVNELCFRIYVNSVDSPTTLLYYKVLLLYCPRFSTKVLHTHLRIYVYLRQLIFVLTH